MLQQKIAAIQEHRSKSAPPPTGPAPYVSSKSFQVKKPHLKPIARQWDRWFSLEASGRYQSSLKASMKSVSPSTMLSLGVGRPNVENYPFDMLAFSGVNVDQGQTIGDQGILSRCIKGEDAYDLGLALNYGYAAGSPQLLRFITEHVELIHSPPYEAWQTCLTCGSTSSIDIVFRMLCDRGDWILVDEYTYSGAIEAGKPLGLNMAGLRMDEFGLLPEDLDLQLRNWNYAKGRKPTVLYTVPSGQNPTGITQPYERRKAIYQMAEHHDLLILEDDPYYLLQLSGGQCGLASNETFLFTEEDEFLNNLPPSYLSLDISGRVIRLDSASKVLAPGLRIGWMTACSQFVAKFLSHTEFSTVAPSGPSQVMLYKILDENWGHEGFVRWLMHLSDQYSRRLTITLEALTTYLPSEICRWIVPNTGMFIWIQVDWTKHPAATLNGCIGTSRQSCWDIEDKIYCRARDNGVQVSKGSWFEAHKSLRTSLYLRLTFAPAAVAELEPAVKMLGDALRSEFMLQAAKDSI